MIDAVAVVVPAWEEAATLPGCLDAVRRALAQLPAGITRTVVVVADRCTDAAAALARGHGAHVTTNTRLTTIGAVRDLGCRTALRALPGIRLQLQQDGHGGSGSPRYCRSGQPGGVSLSTNSFALVPARSYTFLAGGIGITPIVSTIAHVAERGLPWRLFCGGRGQRTPGVRRTTTPPRPAARPLTSPGHPRAVGPRRNPC